MTHVVSAATIIIGRRAILCHGIAALLQGSRYKVIAIAQRASEINDAAKKQVVIIIVCIDDSSDNIAEVAESIKALRSQFLDIKIVVIAEVASIDIRGILALDPDCFIANLESRGILLKLLELTMHDQQVVVLSGPRPVSIYTEKASKGISPSIIPNARDSQQVIALSAAGAPKFSHREREVLRRLAAGDPNKEIARLCNITESTVKVHLKAILRKITAQNRTQAAIWAIANGYHAAPESSD